MTALLAAEEQKRPGPPSTQISIKGSTGAIDFEGFQGIVRRSDDGWPRIPFTGAIYWGQRHKQALMQGQVVYRYRYRPLSRRLVGPVAR